MATIKPRQAVFNLGGSESRQFRSSRTVGRAGSPLQRKFLLLRLSVEIEYDPGKDAINRLKHGISLADAARMDLARAVVVADTRRDYGEARFLAAAPIDGRVHMLAFTIRGDALRAISLRRANKREADRYGKATVIGD